MKENKSTEKMVKKGFLRRLVERESCPYRLSRSIALGLYLAFSPFVGLQTWIAFPLAPLLRANVAVAIIVLYAVSNPWAFIPIIVFNYMFSEWLIEGVLGYDLTPYNPVWMEWVNAKIGPYLYSWLGVDELCFWCFFIGSNIVALVITLAMYPFIMRMSKRLVARFCYVSEDSSVSSRLDT